MAGVLIPDYGSKGLADAFRYSESSHRAFCRDNGTPGVGDELGHGPVFKDPACRVGIHNGYPAEPFSGICDRVFGRGGDMF